MVPLLRKIVIRLDTCKMFIKHLKEIDEPSRALKIMKKKPIYRIIKSLSRAENMIKQIIPSYRPLLWQFFRKDEEDSITEYEKCIELEGYKVYYRIDVEGCRVVVRWCKDSECGKACYDLVQFEIIKVLEDIVKKDREIVKGYLKAISN